MKIELLHAYQGRLTGETLLEAGLQEVEDVLGEYLISNGHAIRVSDLEEFANGENVLDETGAVNLIQRDVSGNEYLQQIQSASPKRKR